MGIADDEIVNPASVSDTLKCSICTDVFEDPVFRDAGGCQHVFCRVCAEQCLQREPTCPLCREPMDHRNLRAHKGFQSLVDELQVRCERSCGWAGRLDARHRHIATCPLTRLADAERNLATVLEQLRQRDEELAECRQQLQNMECANKRETDELKAFIELNCERKGRMPGIAGKGKRETTATVIATMPSMMGKEKGKGKTYPSKGKGNDVLGRPTATHAQPLTLTSLSGYPLATQKQMIGEKLYPTIARSHPEMAGKITGYILQMELFSLLMLLESEPQLRVKVDEALMILRS